MKVYYPYTDQHRAIFSRLMKISGDASLSVKPDTARVRLEVVTENELLTQAQQQNTMMMNQVIEALLKAGVPRENLQTAAYNIFPIYDYVDGQQEFRTYQVTNSLTVKIANINEVGKLIDIAVENGVNRVSNIQLSIDNAERYYQQALSDALQNAISKAQTIAETLNVPVDLTPIKVVEESIESASPLKTFATMEGSQATPIEPGQMIIRVRIEAQFRY